MYTQWLVIYRGFVFEVQHERGWEKDLKMLCRIKVHLNIHFSCAEEEIPDSANILF